MIKQVPKLNLTDVKDEATRKNFEDLTEFMESDSQLLGFEFFDLTFTEAESSVKVAHTLGSQPQDVLVTRATGAAVTFEYDDFDSQYLILDVAGAARVRFFAGTYHGTPQRNT